MDWNKRFSPYIMCILLLLPGLTGAQDLFDADTINYYNETETPATDDLYLESEQENRPIDKAAWNKASNGIDYSGEPEKPAKEKAEPWDFNFQFPELFGYILQFLGILTVAALIFLIVWLIVRNSSKNRAVQNANTQISASNLQQLEENLLESDLDRALREALEQKDYRLAIRIYYLAIIKELNAKRIINWKRDKTNGQYVFELLGTDHHAAFRDLTLDFERVWYGEISITETDYQVLSPRFSQFIEGLKTTKS